MQGPVFSFRELRLELGLSLAQLASSTGIDLRVLSDLERGKGLPDAGVLSRLACLYGVPVPTLAVLSSLPVGLSELLARPGVQFTDALIRRLCRLEFREGQALSADGWLALARNFQLDVQNSLG